ncbi:TauD/TfdA family dioxygenase [Streptomyces sp. MS06]|uniref:TauD/TfdA family dioxygenase n=1 Tax=Streptomyces sp. MS06 TaxID=3385974 RepID=UPI0039A09BBF
MNECAPRDFATVRLSPADRKVIEHLAAQLSGTDPDTEVGRYVLQAQLLAAGLPARVRTALLRFRQDGDARGGILLRGLPLGQVPPTPEDADRGGGLRLLAAHVLSLVVGVVGEQFGFLPELSGRIVQDILPVSGFEDTQHSISSRALLELHCETAFTESRADFVALLCLRADPERRAATLVSPVRESLARLAPATVELLREPRFVTTVDGSFLRGSGIPGPVTVGPISLLGGSADHPRMRCDFAETKGTDPLAREAVSALHEAASASAHAVRLCPGDLLLVDNHSAFHGRTSFIRHGEGRDRWLLRGFVARDLARSIVNRPGAGRIIDIDYEKAASGAAPNRAAAAAT